ncbi:aminoglycoside phosphotransferase family protein [Actinokineospora sp. UTMC 2448]|uniref:aminoglycoside phosphotransferase family protein n=1 Tax=Actinokineospora sp. UTMC 2448 TaxID=2268449 RepID=UPI0021642168|nr:aminoglycoside phosphotransferase family protein [Actinokineospora sp. UTMC 2448]UVS77218.1 Phosphotransferase enzyme family protein [Actinokineospora sp. UTMC 2448]
MATASGVRIGWTQLPAHVRHAVETILGDTVVEAVSQAGGFSPGTADRVRTAGGVRAFVKAVGSALNEHSPSLHRREARVTSAMPDWAPVPTLLGHHDDGDWVVLVFQDIDGRHPSTPWRPDELRAVLTALDEFAAKATPSPVPNLDTVATQLTQDLTSWHRIAENPPDDLHPWAARHLSTLRTATDRALAALDGDTLTHMDIRADNILIADAVTFVDWPWACRGPSWLDSTMLLINVCLYGGHDVSALLTERAVTHCANRDDLVAVLAAMAGFFTDAARQPPPPGLPTVRAFQHAQATALLDWLSTDLTDR